MGSIISFSPQIQKEIEDKEKANNKPKNGKMLCCDFCGARARQTIIDVKGKIIFSCFDCISSNCKSLTWIKSTEKNIKNRK